MYTARTVAAALALSLTLAGAGCGSRREAATEPRKTTRTATREPSMPQEKRQDQPLSVDEETLDQLEEELVKTHGKASRRRIHTGLAQVVARWRRSDGGFKEVARFVKQHFISDEKALAETARHLEYALEMLDGHAHEVARELARFQVLDEGPTRPVDTLLAAYSPTAHIVEDLFKSRVAFVTLLNFPITTLEQRLRQGRTWSRERWALARLAARFEQRIPADVLQENDRVSADVERYIDSYNVVMNRLELADGTQPLPDRGKLISHWGLRDEIRGLYGAKNRTAALAAQRLIARVMERIIRQEIPARVIDSDRLWWDPVANRVKAEGGEWDAGSREPDARYEHLLAVFRAKRRLDPFFPANPTHVDRVFNLQREIPERRMRRLLTSVLKSAAARRTGALISKQLGRPLEPFDLWYTGFRPKSARSEPELDRITRARYPGAKAFEKDIPRILGKLGFSKQTAAFLAERIVVDPARGAGHADGPRRREDRAHLRTRIAKQGMSYKGYNIAIHELGHNVEQVFSMARIDHTLLEGVPNTGFTEAFAFLFQARDLELLGPVGRSAPARGGPAALPSARKATRDPAADAMRTLDRFWATYEIAGVALLDIDIWRWMYEHEDATPARLREATVQLARKLWNTYYAPVFGVKDQVLPAIYSHIIAYGLYTPDYPLGKLITFQVERHMKGKNLGAEMERMCRLGRLAPDVWMRQAVGSDISEKPLLEAVQAALEQLDK
jgi:hypothetical protein